MSKLITQNRRHDLLAFDEKLVWKSFVEAVIAPWRKFHADKKNAFMENFWLAAYLMALSLESIL